MAELANLLRRVLETDVIEPPVRQKLAPLLAQTVGAEPYIDSLSTTANLQAVIMLIRCASARQLLVSAPREETLGKFAGRPVHHEDLHIKCCPCDHENLTHLRQSLPWLRPTALGLKASIGCGDRLGVAGPGQIRAVRGSGLRPALAQQSVREMNRTATTPQQVIDNAAWAVLQEGYHQRWGADADHLKTPADVRAAVEAGFTTFTIDPSESVVDTTAMNDTTIAELFERLPWAELRSSPRDYRRTYVGRHELRGKLAIELSIGQLQRFAVKYARALVHCVRMAEETASRMGQQLFEIEISLDEADSPTSPAEHLFFASELRRLGVRNLVAIAPRFCGRFEKAVDYIGPLQQFEKDFNSHLHIARCRGPYKLSIHSGSDKFSIYPIIARLAGALVHLKTSGTSYLQALRVAAAKQPELFYEILKVSLENFQHERQGYQISADPTALSHLIQQRSQKNPIELLDNTDARQVLHVCFGAVLRADGGRLGKQLRELLWQYEQLHYQFVAEHLRRHLAPFNEAMKGESSDVQ